METVEYKGFTIKIINDDNPESPRECDNFGTMAYKHSNYTLGEEKISDPIDWLREKLEIDEEVLYEQSTLESLQADFFKKFAGHRLFIYDHSGITISTGAFGCRWDSGQYGYIYCTLEKAIEELSPEGTDFTWESACAWGGKVVTLREAAEGIMQSEVTTFDHYCTGSVYGFQVEDENGEELDSYWGFFGDPKESGLLDDAQGSIDFEIERRIKANREAIKQHGELVKKYIKVKLPLIYRTACINGI